MSGNFVKIVLVSVMGVWLSDVRLVAADVASAGGEDGLIVRALLSEQREDYAESMRIFLKLYRLTGRAEYLAQAARESLMLPDGKGAAVLMELERWTADKALKSSDRYPVRMLVALYAKRGKVAEAEHIADSYLLNSSSVNDMKIAASIKIDAKKYKEAAAILQKIYEKNEDEKVMLQEALLLDKYLGQHEKARKLVEKHLKKHPDATVAVYFKLIEFYARQKRADKVLELYKKLYEKDARSYFLQKIIKISLYLKDLKGLAAFLEKHDGNEELLYTIYKELDRFDKAIALAHRRYAQTHRPKWLAEEAILIYEEARSGKEITPAVLKKFQKLFEKALKEGVSDSLYLNYYGYTLIDHDLDIERGLELVKLALKQKPENTYYLDSLAWGLYKKGECGSAYSIMEHVMAQEGLSEPEIRMHWEAIRMCAGSNINSGGETK